MAGRELRALEEDRAGSVREAPLPRELRLVVGEAFTAAPSPSWPRVRVDGKFFRCGAEKWFVKGLTYGPFAPDESGLYVPPRHRVQSDFAQVRKLGANAIRVYHTPPRWLLDEAAGAGLRVMIDVPWEKHRCFLEDDAARLGALRAVREAARLGAHPAVFAVSVANETPKDIVRYYGARRVERFVRELLDAAKQQSPDCLVTYTNYPSCEFLSPGPVDFLCYNVYLEDPDKLAAYLDRLQHLAAAAPLVLGEHGLDARRNGEQQQARQLREQLGRVHAHGLAGSFVFSFTDDWFAGGAQVQDWCFGVTDARRQEKPAAMALRGAWSDWGTAPIESVPSVSVVVCSYNGASTLRECLRSLVNQRYPDLEIILVDDGSTDDTREIAARFPEVRYVHQENRGLSAARNVGAGLARGEIVAYTDSDCVADEDWLNYLVRDMQRHHVEAIGGPNIPPPEDGWIARCVAASPGGPSHVMLDDRRAEHVPGCNMAFRREALLAVGGFDEQFRVAGDDVDVCWRLIDAGRTIGYAPSAVVWHHRRNTVRGYLRQQSGYGRSEALLYFKHPARFGVTGNSRWDGVIYGDGARGLGGAAPVIYHGQFGQALFPAIYRHNRISPWAYSTLLEWYAAAAGLLVLSTLWPPLALGAAAMAALSLLSAARGALGAQLPRPAPWWCRGLVVALHLAQPLVRGWQRYRWRFATRNLPRVPDGARTNEQFAKTIDPVTFDVYWHSTRGCGRELLLEHAARAAADVGWRGDFSCPWDASDLLLVGDNWHSLEVRTATEELGGPNRFTRARVRLRTTGLAVAVTAALTLWSALAVARDARWAQWLAILSCVVFAGRLLVSRRNCRRATVGLLHAAARGAGLVPVVVRSRAAQAAPVAAHDSPHVEESKNGSARAGASAGASAGFAHWSATFKPHERCE